MKNGTNTETAKKAKVNLIKAEGTAFTEALNAAGTEDMERALRFKGLPASKRRRIEAALAARTNPKPAGKDKTPPQETAEPEPVKAAAKVGANNTPKRPKKPSGLDAAAAVLAEAGTALNTAEMVKRMLEGGLWTTAGKTPAATIYSAIIREIAVKGQQSRFRKTDRGLFELTAAGKQAQ